MRRVGACQRCRELLSDGKIHLVQGPMCRWRMTATDDRDEQRFVRGKTRWATREHAGANRRVRLIGQDETIAGAMTSPRLVKEVLKALGKQLVGHKKGKKTPESRLWKEKREEIDWVLKQKLFDYVPENECAERQGRPYSLKWFLKNKGEKVRARLVVREICEREARTELCFLQCHEWRV